VAGQPDAARRGTGGRHVRSGRHYPGTAVHLALVPVCAGPVAAERTTAVPVLDRVPAGAVGSSRHRPDLAVTIGDLPALNASLNALSAVFLVTGYVLIRRAQRDRHKACMLAALTTSTAFLISYVIYHANSASR